MIHLYLEIEPVAKGRPRTDKRGWVYTPKETRLFERDLQFMVRQQFAGIPLTGPLNVHVTFFMRRPKGVSKKLIAHVKRPDADNLLKSVFDSLNGILWNDDSQIYQGSFTKLYCGPSQEPAIRLKVLEVEGK